MLERGWQAKWPVLMQQTERACQPEVEEFDIQS